jgi:iron complex transport system substrate-binding protein
MISMMGTALRRSVADLLGLFVLLASLALAAGPALAAEPAGHADTGGGRVVSIGGAITEIVYALDAQDRLVAVDSTSDYPPEAADLPNVGYMRQLAVEPILALEPTLVLAVEDAGPPAVLDQLRAAGAHLVIVPDDPSPAGVLEKVTIVARALGLGAEGKEMAARLEESFARLRGRLASVDRKPKVLFLLSIGNGAPLAAGRDTAAAGIIALAGGRNAIDAFAGFKPLSPEAAVTAAPDVLLVPRRSLHLLGGRDGLLARPELAGTPAGRQGHIVAMDGLLLLGFGPRTPAAIRELAGALHPELSPSLLSD